jgi:putative CocE/NonD family hydrolase
MAIRKRNSKQAGIPSQGRTGRRRGRSEWLGDWFFSHLLHLPAATSGYTVYEGLEVPMRDGVKLIADRYVPTAPVVLGTVLVRSPYGRRPPYSNLYARIFAARGYQVVIQSCRGTFGSEGGSPAASAEIADGEDTIDWLRNQLWFTGTYATLGLSYLGWTQWTQLGDPPPELVASVVVVGPHDVGKLIRGTGALALETAFGWADSSVTQEDHGWFASIVIGTLTTKRRTAKGVDGLPLLAEAEKVLQGRAPYYGDWLSHEDNDDDFWQAHRVAINGGNVSILLVGGWQDVFVEQTVEQFGVLNSRGANVALTMGPWTHVDTLARGSGIATREALLWLDTYLARKPVPNRPDPVRIFVTGIDSWRGVDSWPPATSPDVWSLRSEGRLSRGPASDGDESTSFMYNPANPTPTIGGRTLNPRAGRRDNALREGRDDVIIFTSDPLDADVEVAGAPLVELHRSADNAFCDVMVRLCEVDRKGVSTNITEAYVRLRTIEELLELTCDPIHHVFRKGNRLRIQIAGGSHPQYDRNLGTGEPAATGIQLKSTLHTIRHNAKASSRITLPVVKGAR